MAANTQAPPAPPGAERVGREALLAALESTSPGLAAREIVEQSQCFVFKRGEVITFNDLIACRAPVPLPKSLATAVQADKLLDVLRKVPDEFISVAPSEGELLVAGKGWEAGVRLQAQITLPVDAVQRPGDGDWQKLPDDFGDAVGLVHKCASLDETKFVLTCVRLHPKWVEAVDDVQLCRWKTAVPVAAPALIQRSAARHLSGLGVTEMAETSEWVHFRNAAGLVISCRRYADDEFPKLGEMLKVEGVRVALPKGLVDATGRAETFSADDRDNNEVLIDLRPGRVRVKGQSATGWFRQRKKLTYEGPPMAFLIPPQLLVDIVHRHSECTLSADRLKADGGAYQYVTVLSSPEAAEAKLKKKAAKSGEDES